MDSPPWRTSAASLVSLFGYLQRLGVSPGEVADAGLVTQAARAEAGGRIATRAFVDVLERCAERLDDPLFGLRYGQSIRPQSLGLAGLFWREAPTFRYNLAVTARFLHLHYEGVTLALTEEAETARIAQHLDVDLRHGARQAVETNISFGLSAGRWILGDHWKPLRVTFAHDPACDPARYAQVIGAPVAFGAVEDALIVKAADLDRPAADRDPLRLLAVERTLLTQALGEPQTLRRRVEEVIDDLLRQKRPRLQTAARDVGLSPRSLQRRLRAEGASFQALLAERRLRAITRERLRGRPVTLAALAESAGFSDATAVCRFLRDHGRDACASAGPTGDALNGVPRWATLLRTRKPQCKVVRAGG